MFLRSLHHGRFFTLAARCSWSGARRLRAIIAAAGGGADMLNWRLKHEWRAELEIETRAESRVRANLNSRLGRQWESGREEVGSKDDWRVRTANRDGKTKTRWGEANEIYSRKQGREGKGPVAMASL